MKTIGKVSIFAGENGRFEQGLESRLRGKTASDGSVILDAVRVSPNEISLTVEKEVADDLFQGNPRINGEISGADFHKLRITDGHGGWRKI